MISVVVPVYRSPSTLRPLVTGIEKILKSYDFEIILIDDNCPLGSWDEILNIKINSPKGKLHAVKLGFNVGQHRAIWEGLRRSTGDQIIVMDCDLQDDPTQIPKLLKQLKNVDAVLARRTERKDSFLKKLSSKIFYKILSVLTGIKFNSEVANFGAYSRDLVDSIITSEGNSPFFPAEVRRLTDNIKYVVVNHNKRIAGNSSYNFLKLLILALNVSISFSKKPLMLIILSGFFIILLSAFVLSYLIVGSLMFGVVVPGWLSLLMAVTSLGGFNILFLGTIAMYVSEIFEWTANKSRIRAVSTFISDPNKMSQEIK